MHTHRWVVARFRYGQNYVCVLDDFGEFFDEFAPEFFPDFVDVFAAKSGVGSRKVGELESAECFPWVFDELLPRETVFCGDGKFAWSEFEVVFEPVYVQADGFRRENTRLCRRGCVPRRAA